MKIEIRNIIEPDCEVIFEWSNDPETRHYSFNSEPITWEEHLQWFHKKLSDKNCYWYHFSSEQTPIGHVRIEKNDVVIISITISPSFRKKGLGSSLIEAGCHNFWKSNNNDIIAYIKKCNIGSIKSFERAGFKKFSETLIKNEPCVVYKSIKNENRLF
jgi:RimJ/RimL family protein N-acetyltransferase